MDWFFLFGPCRLEYCLTVNTVPCCKIILGLGVPIMQIESMAFVDVLIECKIRIRICNAVIWHRCFSI